MKDIYEKNKYANIVYLKYFLASLSLISTIFLLFYKYSSEYKCVVLLPIVYLFSLIYSINDGLRLGLGGITVVIAYFFRMSILPMICAYGDFWIEVNASIYIKYFPWAISLMILENLFVFYRLSYYSLKYNTKMVAHIQSEEKNKGIIVVTLCLAFSAFIILFIGKDIASYYHFIFTNNPESDTSLMYTNNYYLIVLLDVIFRPAFSFYAISVLLKKKNTVRIVLSLIIAFFNITLMTDRRVLSLLIGLICLMEVVYHLKSRIVKYLIYVAIVFGVIGTFFYCFSTDMFSSYLVARKFQRYFSGPTLSSIGIAVWIHEGPNFLDFCKLLLNDSMVFSGLFGTFEVKSYVISLCGSAGKSIWTPMVIGNIQYFGIFAPVVLNLFIKYIVYNDCYSKQYDGVQKMIIDYLSVSIAIYLVMYSTELIVYNIIFIGGFWRVIFYLNSKIKIIYSKRKISS